MSELSRNEPLFVLKTMTFLTMILSFEWKVIFNREHPVIRPYDTNIGDMWPSTDGRFGGLSARWLNFGLAVQQPP